MTGAPKGRKKVGAKKKVMRRSGKSPEIRCLLIPADGETLLLPMTAMAEVVDITQLQAIEDAPPWLLGQIEWESRQVPVFSFSALINGKDVGTLSARSKIMVLKSLSESTRVPYLGLLLNDLPRPVTVKEDTLVSTGDEKKSLGVYSRITIEEQDAIVPDLDRLTHLVTHATLGALPITQLDT
jgi:chemosensory pili system protein ChpC